jgi:hypothetical protein
MELISKKSMSIDEIVKHIEDLKDLENKLGSLDRDVALHF